jgi:cyclase
VTRFKILGVLIIIGALSMAVAAEQQGRGQGRGPAPEPALEMDKVRDNLYVLRGGCNCGDTTFFITDSGVVLIDTKLPGHGKVILEKLRSVTNKPIAMIINTHTHSDHTGSNTEFGMIDTLVAHENTKANLSKPTCTPSTNCDAFKGKNARFLPNTTFKDRRSLLSGKDRIDLYYFGPGHTNGDAWIVFPALRVGMAGDLFPRKGLPVFDAANGGSALHFSETVAKGVAAIKNVDTVISGHDAAFTWHDLAEYSELHKQFLANALAGMKAGKSVDEVASAYKAPERFKDFAIDPARARSLVQGIYDESKAKR